MLYLLFLFGLWRQCVTLCADQPTIFFDTQEVSKPGSSHPLNEVSKLLTSASFFFKAIAVFPLRHALNHACMQLTSVPPLP